MIRRLVLLAACTFLIEGKSTAGTLVTFDIVFNTTVGRMELELYDEDKPVTVSNFIKYAVSGRYQGEFISRWEPGFVIQGGGYRVIQSSNQLVLAGVESFGAITNEYSRGRPFSNTYGTIAMARQPGKTNSATSEWYINLGNNAGLDNVDGGFTVFGHLLSGTNVLNLFVPPPPTYGIYRETNVPPFNALPVLKSPPTFADLLYVQLSLRRDLGLKIAPGAAGPRQITWNSVAGLTNILEYSDSPASGNWTVASQILGTGQPLSFTDRSGDKQRSFRVKIFY